MKGLLLKDFYNLSGQIKIYAIFPIFAGLLSFQQGNLMMLQFMVTFVSMFLVISACAYDEMANFNPYALTLPLTRKDLILTKYIGSFLFLIINFLLVLIIGFVLINVLGSDHFSGVIFREFALESLVIGIACNALVCVLLPLMFKFGTEKARIVLMIMFLSIGGIGYLLGSINLTWLASIDLQFMNDYLIYIVAVLAILVEAVSISISNRIYIRKEF